MPQIKENFFENILFKFESCSCDCVEDIEHIAPGAEPISKFKLQAMPEHPILFGYAAKDGLVRIAPNGTIKEKNILGQGRFSLYLPWLNNHRERGKYLSLSFSPNARSISFSQT